VLHVPAALSKGHRDAGGTAPATQAGLIPPSRLDVRADEPGDPSNRESPTSGALVRDLTFAGLIVLAPSEGGDLITDEQKTALDALHQRKIDPADRLLVVNPGGYIGASTSREIAHARATGKPISFTNVG